MLRRGGEGIIDTDKLDLKEDYETPKPLGLDLFRQCGQLTDYQWTLLSGCVVDDCCSNDGGGGGDADSGDNSSDDVVVMVIVVVLSIILGLCNEHFCLFFSGHH